MKRFLPPAIALAMLTPALCLAHSYGPPPRVTAAPGDDQRACTVCHTGTALNAGGGKLEIILPNGPTYTPGLTQHLTVRISDPAQHRWGFELSARLNKDPANLQAGDLNPTDSFTQAFCDTSGATGLPKPCDSSKPVQFISHTTEGTRNGTANGVTFEFDWTPPATDAGAITLYAAGNAANGNGSPSGDHIYTTSIQLTTGPAAKPAISGGVVNAAGFQATIAPNSWVTLFGAGLANTTRLWSGADLTGGKLPQALSGTSVTINGKPAYVEYISAGQVNVLTPDDQSAGPVQVQITTPAGVSDPITIQMQPLSPAFFQADAKFLAATHADGSPITAAAPAKPGETIILYGTGFGATNPATPYGQVVAQNASLAGGVQVTIAGAPATTTFAGLIAGFAGLFQFNVAVPASASSGSLKVVAQVNGVTTPDSSTCCFIPVQQ